VLNLYYHKDVKLHSDFNRDLFESFRDFWPTQTELIKDQKQKHISNSQTYQKECEVDNDFQRGVLVEPPIMRFLPFHIPEQCIPVDDLNVNDGVLIISWLSLFNLSKEDYDTIFQEFTGHVFIDDTFETHVVRTLVFKNFLEHLGYDTSNVSFWTNGASRTNSLDFENNYFRNNWLHLTEYGNYLNVNKRNRIKEIEDKSSLTAHSNKKYKALYMNGHSTAQREFVLGLFAENGYLDNFLYSFRNPHDAYKDFWNMATSRDRDSYIPKSLPNDHEDQTVRDRYKQDVWWAESFFNINLETNYEWINTDVTMLTEKWMKGILYLTPSFNLGDYHGLEEYQKNLGFEIYEDFLNKEYDKFADWETRNREFVKSVIETPRPTEAEWSKMMEIAQHNYHHLHEKYIPNLANLLISALEKVVKNT